MNYKDLFIKIIKDKDLTLDFSKVKESIRAAIKKNNSSVKFEDAVKQIENIEKHN